MNFLNEAAAHTHRTIHTKNFDKNWFPSNAVLLKYFLTTFSVQPNFSWMTKEYTTSEHADRGY